jgi:hypothetical protein
MARDPNSTPSARALAEQALGLTAELVRGRARRFENLLSSLLEPHANVVERSRVGLARPVGGKPRSITRAHRRTVPRVRGSAAAMSMRAAATTTTQERARMLEREWTIEAVTSRSRTRIRGTLGAVGATDHSTFG